MKQKQSMLSGLLQGRVRRSARAAADQEALHRVRGARGAARPTSLWLVLALVLAGTTAAFAQSNGVPGPEDYTGFSKFITERNIFDPTRQPHYSSNHTYTRPRTRARATPGIRFVGTMSYEKGMFAFFAGNSTEQSQVLQTGQKIAGYTVTEIEATSVVLESADKKEQHNLKIGDGLTEENGKWVFLKSGELPVAPAAADTAGSASSDGTSTPAAVPAAIEGNDILKRLMEKRQKENQ